MTTIQKFNLTVGGPAYYMNGYGEVRSGHVLRITPTGQVVVRSRGGIEYRFNANGNEMNPSSSFRVGYLISKDDYDRRNTEALRSKLGRQLHYELKQLVEAKDANDPEMPDKLRALADRIQAFQNSK